MMWPNDAQFIGQKTSGVAETSAKRQGKG